MRTPTIAGILSGGQFLALGLLAISAGACSFLPGSSSTTGGVPTTVPLELIDGYVLGAPLALPGQAFHRLEVTARDTWRASHPEDILTGFELRSVAGSAAPVSSADGILEFMVVVTVVGGERHVVALRCDPSTFPAEASCS